VSPAELIQFGEKVADLHGRRSKDAPGSGGPPALCGGQAAVKRFPDHIGDRCTALPCDRANPLVTLIVDENLQPMCQHAHTLACTYGDAVMACARRSSAPRDAARPTTSVRIRRSHGSRSPGPMRRRKARPPPGRRHTYSTYATTSIIIHDSAARHGLRPHWDK